MIHMPPTHAADDPGAVAGAGLWHWDAGRGSAPGGLVPGTAPGGVDAGAAGLAAVDVGRFSGVVGAAPLISHTPS